MCGIFGAIDLSGFFERTSYEKFVKLADMVSYRGPDASGYLPICLKGQSIDDREHFDVFLGHRRLSIIDLSEAGNQPFTDGGGAWIIFNGEIFNYVELRDELRLEGYTFRTATDTEVILKVYAEWGEQGFDRLNGMWAFALVDIPRRKIVLSRDRFSIKPLYFLRQNNHLYFASEIKQLLPLLARREINPQIMFAYLEQGLLDHNCNTFYRNILKVAAKTNLVICMDGTQIEERQYWEYQPEEGLSWDDTVDRFRELFADSVRIRLRSDVKVGALLSGGLDSSAIAVLASAASEGGIETYSVIAQDRRYSEEEFIDALCVQAKISNTKLCLNQDDAFRSLDAVLYHNDEPFGGLSVVAQYKVLEQIRKETDVTVVLSGQGGDELLLGYLKFFFFYLRQLIRQGRPLRALREVLASLLNRTILWQFRLGLAKRYVPFLQRREGKAISLLQGDYEPIWDSVDLRERQIADIDKYSVPCLTHYEDRNSMAHSLEIRLPFLDHRLVNFLVNLPAEMKLRNGWTKYILRHSLPELPDVVRWRRDKQGFITPEEMWLKKHFSETIKATFRKSRLEQLGIIDGKSFMQRYDQFRKGSVVISHKDIARVFIAELWVQKFLS